MTPSTAVAEMSSRFEKVTDEVRIPVDQLTSLSPPLVDAVALAGFQSAVCTVAFAGQYATGSFAVQVNSPTGGFSSTWPQWAFELAKAALVANKRVWVGSNGDPFGSNLVFVLIFP